MALTTVSKLVLIAFFKVALHVYFQNKAFVFMDGFRFYNLGQIEI